MEGAAKAKVAADGDATSPSARTKLKDYANFRTSRVFLQHLPYKSVVSTFSYVPPTKETGGAQAKYGLFPTRFSNKR